PVTILAVSPGPDAANCASTVPTNVVGGSSGPQALKRRAASTGRPWSCRKTRPPCSAQDLVMPWGASGRCGWSSRSGASAAEEAADDGDQEARHEEVSWQEALALGVEELHRLAVVVVAADIKPATVEDVAGDVASGLHQVVDQVGQILALAGLKSPNRLRGHDVDAAAYRQSQAGLLAVLGHAVVLAQGEHPK